MKNIIKTSLLFVAFVIGGIIFQLSCSNSDEQNFAPVAANKVLFTKGVGEFQSLWICDYDGSNLSPIPITLPSGIILNGNNGNAYPRLSPDGQKIFFVCMNQNDSSSGIFTCDVSGSNLQEIYNTGIPSSTNNTVLGLGTVN